MSPASMFMWHKKKSMHMHMYPCIFIFCTLNSGSYVAHYITILIINKAGALCVSGSYIGAHVVVGRLKWLKLV